MPVNFSLSIPLVKSDRSTVITLGGTAQPLMATNAGRQGASMQNLSTGDLWVNTTGTATGGGGSEWVPPGSLWATGAETTAFSIFGATTGQAFTAKEW